MVVDSRSRFNVDPLAHRRSEMAVVIYVDRGYDASRRCKRVCNGGVIDRGNICRMRR